ncbi:MAG: acyl carrier protein [Brevinematales bacterium]|nr:acyl carrier protein [Brevinematales bacterium]
MGGNPDEVKAIIASKLGVDVSKVQDGVTLADLGANKLTLVELGAELEERYRLDCPPEIAVGFQTVGDVFEFVR